MRLDEAGSRRTESAPSHSTVFSPSASGTGDTELFKLNRMKFSKDRKKTQLGFCHTFFSYPSFNPGFFLQVTSLQGPSGRRGRSGKYLICWPQKRRSFHMGERSVKTSLPTRRRFQPRISQLLPEARQPCCRPA